MPGDDFPKLNEGGAPKSPERNWSLDLLEKIGKVTEQDIENVRRKYSHIKNPIFSLNGFDVEKQSVIVALDQFSDEEINQLITFASNNEKRELMHMVGFHDVLNYINILSVISGRIFDWGIDRER